VPEPELTLMTTSSGKIVGYTIGNDMSSRSIEGENPLYLPQAKTYDGCAAVGPCIYVSGKPFDIASIISLEIIRQGKNVFNHSISVTQMKRSLEELVCVCVQSLFFPFRMFNNDRNRHCASQQLHVAIRRRNKNYH
jgi:2-dehydro-3-deoxy-D-arabinonate dehydratase